MPPQSRKHRSCRGLFARPQHGIFKDLPSLETLTQGHVAHLLLDPLSVGIQRFNGSRPEIKILLGNILGLKGDMQMFGINVYNIKFYVNNFYLCTLSIDHELGLIFGTLNPPH